MLAKFMGVVRQEEPLLMKGYNYNVYFRESHDGEFPGMPYVAEVRPAEYDKEASRYTYLYIGYLSMEDILEDWSLIR